MQLLCITTNFDIQKLYFLWQILNDKTQDRKIGIDILNALQRADRKRSTWKNVGNK